MSKTVLLSEKALKRMPRYLSCLKALQQEQCVFVTAPAVAKHLGLNEVQVRKELSLMSSSPGRPRTGFEINNLIENIETYLGYRNVDDAVLVGAGSLGRALLGYHGFDQCGIHIVAAFDRNEGLHGRYLHDKPIFPLHKITNLCDRLKIRIGIIAVPQEQAQAVCDQLVAGGVLAIWNFSTAHLKVPESVLVRNEDLAASLAILSRQLREKLQVETDKGRSRNDYEYPAIQKSKL